MAKELTMTDSDEVETEQDHKQLRNRLAIRPGFEHLAGRHLNRYPIDIEPDVDPEKYCNSLEWIASCG